MKNIFKTIILALLLTIPFISCAKKPLTLDEETSMKTLLKASDKEITDLVIKEVTDKTQLNPDDVSVKYILRDTENQAIAVKIKTSKDDEEE